MDENVSPASESAPAPQSGPNPEKVAQARELVEGILVRMGVSASLVAEDRPDGIYLTIAAQSGEEALERGGRSGVIESIAYLVNKSINRDEVGRKWVHLALTGAVAAEQAPGVPEAGGQADPVSIAWAEELVVKSKAMGRPLWVGAMTPSRRAGLQAALSQVAGTSIRVEGEGVYRRLVIGAG